MGFSIKCWNCGSYLDGHNGDGGTMNRLLLPVGRPMSAIAAGYLAMFGILPIIGLPFALGALICGLVALTEIQRDPRLSGIGRAWFGIIAGGTIVFLSGLVAIYLLVFGPEGR